MSQKYTEGFKIQAVEKALNRSSEITQTEMANTLGISRSTLQRWITQSKNHQWEPISVNTPTLVPTMIEKEKRLQDWSSEERLKLIIKSEGFERRRL